MAGAAVESGKSHTLLAMGLLAMAAVLTLVTRAWSGQRKRRLLGSVHRVGDGDGMMGGGGEGGKRAGEELGEGEGGTGGAGASAPNSGGRNFHVRQERRRPTSHFRHGFGSGRFGPRLGYVTGYDLAMDALPALEPDKRVPACACGDESALGAASASPSASSDPAFLTSIRQGGIGIEGGRQMADASAGADETADKAADEAAEVVRPGTQPPLEAAGLDAEQIGEEDGERSEEHIGVKSMTAESHAHALGRRVGRHRTTDGARLASSTSRITSRAKRRFDRLPSEIPLDADRYTELG